LEAVHIEGHDGKGAPGPVVTLDYRVESDEKRPVVGKPGERIGDRQLAHGFIGALVFGKFGGKRHGRNGHDANEGLQQQQRGVLRLSRKWAKALRSAPGGHGRQQENGRGSFAAAKAKRRPEQERNAKVFQGIVLQRGGKASDQEATDHTFEGVSRRNAERGGDGTGGGPVYQERPGQNGGPYAIAEDEEGGEREAGARPNGGGAGVHKRQL